MKKFLEKIITGFFVVIFGIIWFCTTKYYVKPPIFKITIYDVYGKETKPNGIRIKFRIQDVALSYIREYQKMFPHLDFSIQSYVPEKNTKRIFSRIIKKSYR